VAGLLLVTWLATAIVFRYSSLAALVSALLAPFYVWWLAPLGAYIVLGAVMSLLLLWRHRANIRNLLAGTETRIGAKSRSAADH
jgi:glycerol-3-phosphate acyltransferase PlsY